MYVLLYINVCTLVNNVYMPVVFLEFSEAVGLL